jgi:Viral BACON domain
VYRGSAGTLPPGTYVYADYCSGEIFAWDGSTQSVLLDTTQNISSFGEDEQGELYVVSLGGAVSRLVSCTYSISPARATFQSAAGSGSVSVTAGAGCAWTAVSNASWISITSGANGIGNGTVQYSVAPYTGRARNRNGTMTIAGQTFSVKQSR